MLINPSTPISQLHDAGIVPDWMYRDCDLHGMDEAENILCEWDWDWNWDLGDGYSKQQLEVLAQVRKFIREGIREFESNPEAIRKHKEEQELKKLRRQRIEEYTRKLNGIVYVNEIPWIVAYELKYGELPVFFLIWFKLVERFNTLPTRTKAHVMLAGVGMTAPFCPEQVAEQLQELTLKQVQSLAKKHFNARGRIEEFASRIPLQLPDRPLTESDPFWQDLRERQCLIRVSPIQLMRIITLVRPDYTLSSKNGQTILLSKN